MRKWIPSNTDTIQHTMNDCPYCDKAANSKLQKVYTDTNGMLWHWECRIQAFNLSTGMRKFFDELMKGY